MNRLVTLAAGCALLPTGCAHEGEWSLSKALGWEPTNRVAMPDTKNLPKPALDVDKRVDDLARKIIARNTFTGIEPLVMTIGVKESVLFHRGSEQLIISEGLVKKCKTDAELAGVLCSELGKMVSEKRAARAAGYNVDPIPETTNSGPLFPDGDANDVGHTASAAAQEKKNAPGAIPADAITTARELLSGAGYNPAELDRVEPLLKQSERGEKLRKQMGSSAPAPEWQK